MATVDQECPGWTSWVEVFHDLVESKLVLVKGDRLHSYDAIHAHYTQLVLKYRAYMIYRTRYEYRTEYY